MRVVGEAEALEHDAPEKPLTLDQITGALEEDIVLCHLHPKERLVEEDLMLRFGAKRHVVRQALVALERIGLVERQRNRGALVKAYSPEEVRQIYDVRELLETTGAELVPMPAPPTLIAELESIQRRHDAAAIAGDLRGVFRNNIAFHRVLFASLGNPYLSQTINEFAQKAHAIRFAVLSDSAALDVVRKEHWSMIEALREGDREALVEVCRQHLRPSRNAYIAAFERRFPR